MIDKHIFHSLIKSENDKYHTALENLGCVVPVFIVQIVRVSLY